ncbi:hypothetical protein B0T11DRAFT_283349 [Plectosphaerella cucumerina]|uniref:Letm1 RBD domain-containing protein n=1 Tax=Plectosphaerella cucumerina TaxID=40658 RepID=A0A8K0TBG9_9PEZI|nr:hypothetical protein B0T11DRAFT_283349 [Plectosphaerella cucumerina]
MIYGTAMRAARASALVGHHHATPFHMSRLALTTIQRRSASSSSDTPSPPEPDTNSTHVYNRALNPPSSTRPPALDVPSRDPSTSTCSYYLSVGKAYIRFYKTGLKAVFANRRLLRAALAAKPIEADRRPPSVLRPSYVPTSYSRADWVLLWRVRHDLLRVPLFGLVLLVCGEFTPLIVLAIDGVVPYTCRLPRQIGGSMAKAESRRAESFEALAAPAEVAPAAARDHVLRSLHLVSTFWDRAGFVMPGLWQIKGNLRMAFLAGDDKLLLQDGGLSGLEVEELRIACAERGIDVLGKGDGELRRLLGDWLRLTASEDAVENRKRMTVLLTTRVDNWPATRDFELPEWHL